MRRSFEWSLPFRVSNQILHAFPISLMRATWSANLILLDLVSLIISGEQFKQWSPSLCSFIQPSVTSSLVGPNILLSTLFSNTLNLCFSLHLPHQVSHPNKTTDYMAQRSRRQSSSGKIVIGMF
jgi:hypothetical protein